MLTIRAMSNGAGYSARHLQHSDYYAEGERVTGQWQGRGAEMLGLAGEVQSEQFEALRQGVDPQSGEFLRQRHSADRTAADGSTQSRGRNLYDFTISAPKSVSIMAQPGGDARLVEAHKKAVGETLTELEHRAASRVRRDQANDNRTTGNLVLSVYHHDTSRELDPQLHTHAVAANLTYDGAEGRWKALQASDIYEQRAYLTEVYRNALAREVRSLGYEIEDRRSSKGKNLGFEIKGVSDELLEKYSQRSEQRDRAIAEFVESKCRQPSDNEVAVLVRESRADKLVEISTAEVHSRQTARLTPEESLTLEQIREQVLGRSQTQRLGPDTAVPSLDYAKQHVFERVSVALDHELLTEALRHGRGRIDLADLKGEFSLEESNGRILQAGKEVATRESLDRERDMIERINRGIGQFERLGGQHEFADSAFLRPEQKQAIEFVLDSRDLAVNIRGAAGTGKTATLQELQRGLEESGRQVLAVAPTMSAVEELQKVGFSDAITVERLLQGQSAQRDLFGKALIVDEAGMVSGRQMSELLKVADQQSARIIFSGDTKQIRSVEASDALRVLERESHLKSVSLSEVQRQTTQGYREAIQELRRDPERGFEKLEQIGAVREVPWPDRAQEVQRAYSEAQSQVNAKGEPRSVLVGGFLFGALAAVAVRYSGLEHKVDRAIEQKVSWTPEAEIVQANALIESGKLDEAAVALNQYLARNVDSFAAWNLLRAVYWRASNIPAYREATAKLCELHINARESEAAWQDYEDFLNAGGENISPSVWLELGRVAEERRDYERAVAEYEKLAGSHSSKREAIVAKISAARLCLQRLNRPHDALRLYKDASASTIPHLDLKQDIDLGIRETRNALSHSRPLSAGASSIN